MRATLDGIVWGVVVDGIGEEISQRWRPSSFVTKCCDWGSKRQEKALFPEGITDARKSNI
jgi:hypothetical protein